MNDLLGEIKPDINIPLPKEENTKIDYTRYIIISVIVICVILLIYFIWPSSAKKEDLEVKKAVKDPAVITENEEKKKEVKKVAEELNEEFKEELSEDENDKKNDEKELKEVVIN